MGVNAPANSRPLDSRLTPFLPGIAHSQISRFIEPSVSFFVGLAMKPCGEQRERESERAVSEKAHEGQ